MKKFVNIEAIDNPEEKKLLEEMIKENTCPFCKDNLSKYHKKPIIRESKHWLITENQWPYIKTKNHIIAIYKDHIENIEEMDDESGLELISLFKEESKKRNISGGGILIRFGSNERGYYGNSINHLHAHLIEPDIENLPPKDTFTINLGRRY